MSARQRKGTGGPARAARAGRGHDAWSRSRKPERTRTSDQTPDNRVPDGLTPDDLAMESLLLGVLRKANRPLGLDEILRITHLPRRSKKALEHALAALQRKERVVRAPGGWTLREGLRHISGTLALQRAGMGFVSPRDGGREVYIHPSALLGAWHGDTVEVLVLPGRRGPNPEGRVTRILARGRSEIAAHAIRRSGQAWICAPAEARLPALFVLKDAEHSPPVSQGDLLILRPEEELGPNLFAAALLTNLEHEHSPAAQERLAKSNNNIPGPFPAAALAEASALPEDPGPADMDPTGMAPGTMAPEHGVKREDLTGHAFVTIDGKNARDFDDAVFVLQESPPGGQAAHFRLLVAIADVSHYVRPGSALDAEALLRGNSCYFPLSVEPMLPQKLSNGLCSLQPGRDRLVMVADMRFDPRGERLAAAFYPAVIRSRARLTYGQIRRGLLENRPDDTLTPFLPMLRNAEALARILLERRKQRGSLDFDLPECEYFFSDQGELLDIRRRERHFGHRLIEECMLAANEAVAAFLAERGQPTLYRVHQPPDPDKLRSLARFLAASGLIPFPPKREKQALSSRDLARVLETTRGAPAEYVVTRLCLRAMMQAMYQSDNEGHYGLASPCYCHFTSPIRRYADLLVHRALKRALGLAPDRPLTRNKLESVARHINECERSAAEAERETHKRLTLLLLRDRVGESFSGVVSGVTDFGLFVELPDMQAEGLIRLPALPGDYYDYIEERQELRGRMTGAVYRLGMPLRVTLTDVNPARLEINFVPAGD